MLRRLDKQPADFTLTVNGVRLDGHKLTVLASKVGWKVWNLQATELEKYLRWHPDAVQNPEEQLKFQWFYIQSPGTNFSLSTPIQLRPLKKRKVQKKST